MAENIKRLDGNINYKITRRNSNDIRRTFNNKNMKKEFLLKGLNCANCAAKIEKEVNNIDGVENAVVNFVATKLIVEIKDEKDLKNIEKSIREIVKRLEPDVEVKEIVKGKTNFHSHEEHAHEHEEEDNKKAGIKLAISAVLFIIALVGDFSKNIELVLYLASYAFVGLEVVVKALKNMIKGEVFDENFLMSIATIGAFAVGSNSEAVAVMMFYQVGEILQGLAVNRSRKSITALMNIRPDFANIKIGETIKKVSPEEVNLGDIIIVKPGEKVPLDGEVIEGKSMVDTSALTGESVPRSVNVGDEVLGGVINENGLLTIKVTKEFGDSTISKILDLVQNASNKKAPTENFITKFARYYTPVVVFLALIIAIIPPLVINGATYSQWIYRALSFLVVSCPCALVVSVPLGFFGGIGGASKLGILVKGGNYLEALNDLDTVVFDKTGTLTKGVFKVTEIKTEKNISKGDLIASAAYVESFSNHPIATSIVSEYGKDIDKSLIKNYKEIAGHGIKALVKGKEVLAGNYKLMELNKIKYPKVEVNGTVVYVALDKKYAGYIVISDEIKEDSKNAIKDLKNIGIKKTVMLTGDNKNVADKVASELQLDEVYSQLLPNEKVEKLEMLNRSKDKKAKLAFVGDGVNDAPVLAMADIGIAMGGVGSDAAIEAADVVIMTDEPSKIVTAIKIAKKTRKVVMENIYIALGVKIVILILVAMGLGTMWEAVFGDVGVTVIAVLNSMRCMKIDNI